MHGRRRLTPKLPLLLSLVFALLLGSNILPTAATGTQTNGPKLCAVSPDQLEGQGLNVTSLGLNVTPLGLNITPLGLNVTSLGLSVTSLGLNVTSLGQTPERVVTDIATNVVTPTWLTQLLPNIQGGTGYNSIKTAVLVVDDFSNPSAHGFDVRKVFTDLLGAVSPAPNVTVHNVDISTGQVGFEATAIAPLIRSQVQTLEAQGYKHFVINLSFGLLPCSDSTDVRLTDTESGKKFTVTRDFSLDQFEQARQQALSNQRKKIVPILECIVRNGPWDYTAYFGYHNENSTAVTIPVGHHNGFFPLPVDRGQPTVFAPGRQNFAFSIRYNGSNQAWILKGPDGWGRTAIAGNSLLQKCYIRGLTPPPDGTLNITPVGYGINQYLTEKLGIPENFVDEYLEYLAKAGQENDNSGIQGLMREYLQRSYNEQQDGNADTIFGVIPVASSGNFRHLFGDTPLRPALYPELIGVGATLGDFGGKWILSHSGNILAPGAGYPFAYDAEGRLARIGAGTSYAAPYVGALSSLWLTYPNACTFGSGLPPLANFATSKFAEATARVNQPSPLNCAVPVEEPPQADLALTKVATPNPVIAGQPLSYLLTVTNNGEDTAANVVVTDTLPVGVTASTVTPSQGTCAGTVCSLGSLNSGSSATVIIVVTAPATATISNTATVTSDTSDPNAANNTASTLTNIQIVLPVAPVLQCVADVGSGTLRAYFGYSNPNSFPVTIEIGARNQFVPGGNLGQPTTFDPGQYASAFSIEFTGSNLVWQLDGQSVTASNDPATRCVDIAITKTAPATVTLGEEFIYIVTITNNGNRPIINLTIRDAMPANAQYDWTTHEACYWDGPIMNCFVGTVNPGESKTIEFGMIATQLGTVTNTATVVSNEPENGGPVNNSATVVTNVIAPDGDGDGYADGSDNCPAVWNDQLDSDGDAIGDLCDSTPLPETITQPPTEEAPQVTEGTEEAPAQ